MVEGGGGGFEGLEVEGKEREMSILKSCLSIVPLCYVNTMQHCYINVSVLTCRGLPFKST